LYFYLLAALYWLATPVWAVLHQSNFLSEASFVVDQGQYFLLGRLLSVAFGMASIYLVYRLGRAAYSRPVGLLAALFLAVEPLHVKYSHVAVTDVPATAFSLLALVLLVTAAKGGGRRWLVAGAAAAGLATATKYNLGALVLPVAVTAVYASRGEVAARVAAGGRRLGEWWRILTRRVVAPMLAAFLLASPFVLLDLPKFIHDFAIQSRIMHTGWLGFENSGNGYWYNFHVNLAGALGLVLLLLALAGLAYALWRRTPLDVMIAPYLILYFAYIGTWKELADRYLLPLVPLLLLLAARLCVSFFRVRPALRSVLAPSLAALVVAAVVLPLTDSIAFNTELTRTDVRLRAKTWVEATIAPGSKIASDTYGPPLVRRLDAPHYTAAGMHPVAYRLVRLKLPLPGRADVRHSLKWLRQRHVKYVIVTSAVYDRILAAAEHYPTQAKFYRRLDTVGTLIRQFRPRAGERGPVIKVYELPAARQRHR
jgi:4-amino-4-deoxy-L-arabinose transferase-like glycosyltransferase